ncbi:MAG: spore coat protein CotJB [Clostridiales bacterium]|nr:spore coat protein CotJB [Clostridiales bacterium]
MTEREILIKKISTYQFAALDLQLFLDTHPNDRKTLMKMKEYRDMAEPLIEEYEKKYGPLTKDMTSTNNWRWIRGPWPWENEEDTDVCL